MEIRKERRKKRKRNLAPDYRSLYEKHLYANGSGNNIVLTMFHASHKLTISSTHQDNSVNIITISTLHIKK